MHRIVKAHLESFVKSNALEVDGEDVQFEKFCNFCILANRYGGTFDIDDVTTGPGDEGIDGVAVVVDEAILCSAEDATSVFNSHRRNHDVDVVFIQSKRSEGFDLGDFLKFKEGILRFATQLPYVSTDDVLLAAREIFDVVLNNVPKVRNGKPSIIARYISNGLYQKPAALETALRDFEIQLNELGLFHEIDIKFVDRDEITRLWVGTYSGVSASLTVFSSAALPIISGIDEAYLAVVKASDLVNHLITTEEGNLRTQVFEENVRSFLGVDNAVNKSIAATLSSVSSSRFPVLNNGITIVCPEIKLQGTTLHLENFQIVNGCQTSNVLFENRDILGDVMVNIKVVKTTSEDVFSELVRATNSQTKVDDNQFLSLKPLVKRVEQYFNSFEGTDSRLYLERRDRQYVGQDIPAIRIFSLHNSAKCVAAMFCGRPELASRYPKQMYDELTNVMFGDDVKESVFYAACMTLYRFNLLVSNSTIPQNLKKFKWHILPLVRAIVVDGGQLQLNAKKADTSAKAIIDLMSSHNQKTIDVFNKTAAICQSMGDVSSDRLKRQAILTEMLAKV